MRLPRLADGKTIDIEQCEAMTDAFLNAGMRYFDTAYVYEGSEEATRRFLVWATPSRELLPSRQGQRQPVGGKVRRRGEARSLRCRSSAPAPAILTSTCCMLWDRETLATMRTTASGSLRLRPRSRGLCGTWVSRSTTVRMSLIEILTRHPEAEFVQLQLNYGDWESPSVCSRENHEVACAHGKPVVVMEPVKGGLSPTHRSRCRTSCARPTRTLRLQAGRYALWQAWRT